MAGYGYIKSVFTGPGRGGFKPVFLRMTGTGEISGFADIPEYLKEFTIVFISV